MKTFEECVQAYQDGILIGLELRDAAASGLTLRNVHARMGAPDVRRVMGAPAGWNRVSHQIGPRSSHAFRASLVFRTWARPPFGGWLQTTAWARLLQLEASLDGAPISDLDADRADPEPAIRAWAVVARDARGEVDGLRVDLRDPSPDVRLLAAGALAERGITDAPVLSALRALLTAPSCSREAVLVLGPLRDPDAALRLIGLFAKTRRHDVLRALAFPAALPILRAELRGDLAHEALEAVQALGPEAVSLLPDLLAGLRGLAEQPRTPGDYLLSGEVPFQAIAAMGDAAAHAGPTLMAWAEQEAPHGFSDNAAKAAGAVSEDARARFASWLPDPGKRRRALEGLAAGGVRSRRWASAVLPLLDAGEGVAAAAAVTLAHIGEVRAARDAWLRFRAWPLEHHAADHNLVALADLLLRDLVDATDLADPEDVARSREALETAGDRVRYVWSSARAVLGDDVARARSASLRALEALRRRLG